MRYVIAAVFAVALASIGIGMIRSLGRTPKNVPLEEVQPVPLNARVTFWCETCGTEVLLLRKGSEAAPRHCGEAMVRREEVTRG